MHDVKVNKMATGCSLPMDAILPLGKGLPAIGHNGQVTGGSLPSLDSPIVNFYRGKNILITGGTGFIGSVLIEKLLRDCETGTIYLLIRSKRNFSPGERLKYMTTKRIFQVHGNTNYPFHKLRVISGDILEPHLGLSAADATELKGQVHIIFHLAASVRFVEPLIMAMKYNLYGTEAVLSLAREMTALQAFVHCSTAFTYPYMFRCKEQLYSMSSDHPERGHDEVTASILEAMLDRERVETVSQSKAMTRSVLGRYLHTYPFSKALTEHLIYREKVVRGTLSFPIGISRPSIVLHSYNEPVPGWCATMNGPIPYTMAAMIGIKRVGYADLDLKGAVVPVDFVANAMIAQGWDLVTNGQRRANEVPILNVCSSAANPMSWRDFVTVGREVFMENPSEKIVRPVTHVPDKNYSNLTVWFYCLFSELLFAIFVEYLILPCMPSVKMSILDGTRRLQLGNEIMRYYMSNEFQFEDDGLVRLVGSMSPGDRDRFACDSRQIDWNAFITSATLGLRRYMLCERDETIPAARVRYRRLKTAYRIIQYLVIGILVALVTSIVILAVGDLAGTVSTSISPGWVFAVIGVTALFLPTLIALLRH